MLPIDKRNFLERKRYEFIPYKHKDGMYSINVFKDDKMIKGKNKYKCWHEAISETINLFYTTIRKNILN